MLPLKILFSLLLTTCAASPLLSGSPLARIREGIPARSRHTRRQTEGITFGNCSGFAFTSPLECGSLTVPLDYTNEEDNRTINLEIYRLASPSEQPKGTIFLNFGGPGDNGRASMDALATVIQTITGGCYDLVTVTPRGTNNTLLFNCYPIEALRAASASTGVPNGNASDVATDNIWADSELFDRTCEVAQNETGRFVGTMSTARDNLAVADALGEDLFNYWGISYGTLLGATIAGRFPERVGRMVLDGVVNAHEYYTNTESELYEDADKAFAAMLSACIDSPTLCPLAGNATSAEQLANDLYTWLYDVKSNPVALFATEGIFAGNGYVVDYATLKALMINALYSPSSWPAMTKFWNDVRIRNVTGAAEWLLDQATAAPALDADAQFGIKCGDVRTPPTSKQETLPVLRAREETSRIAGDTAHHIVARCAQWRLPAAEHYRGSFDVETATPVLFIGNTADPVSPLASAKNMSSSFVGSVWLEHGGIGHTSLLSQASSCTFAAVRKYFENGTLPVTGTYYPPETKAFGEVGVEAALLKLGGGSCQI